MKAFPSNPDYIDQYGNNKHVEDGMDLRDYFAAKAMQGMLSNPELVDTMGESTEIWIKDNVYKISDAMIEARRR